MMRSVILGVVLISATVSMVPTAVVAGDVTWQGTTFGWDHDNTSAYFDPNRTGTTITGTLNITNLAVGGVEMFGLIDKKHKDSGGYMSQSGAYLYLSKTPDGVLMGTSDGTLSYGIPADATNVGAINVVDFTLTVHNGMIELTSSLFAGTKSRSYGVVKTLYNMFGYGWDEFAEGAYLGGCLYPQDSSVDFDVTAGPAAAVPLPAGAWMGLSLIVGIGIVRRIRRAA